MSDLFTFIDQLRARGVRTFKGKLDGEVVEIELGAAPVVDAPQGPAGKDETVCNCKCPVYAHTNGLCLAGCEPEACNGPEALA